MEMVRALSTLLVGVIYVCTWIGFAYFWLEDNHQKFRKNWLIAHLVAILVAFVVSWCDYLF